MEPIANDTNLNSQGATPIATEDLPLGTKIDDKETGNGEGVVAQAVTVETLTGDQPAPIQNSSSNSQSQTSQNLAGQETSKVKEAVPTTPILPNPVEPGVPTPKGKKFTLKNAGKNLTYIMGYDSGRFVETSDHQMVDTDTLILVGDRMYRDWDGKYFKRSSNNVLTPYNPGEMGIIRAVDANREQIYETPTIDTVETAKNDISGSVLPNNDEPLKNLQPINPLLPLEFGLSSNLEAPKLQREIEEKEGVLSSINNNEPASIENPTAVSNPILGDAKLPQNPQPINSSINPFIEAATRGAGEDIPGIGVNFGPQDGLNKSLAAKALDPIPEAEVRNISENILDKGINFGPKEEIDKSLAERVLRLRLQDLKESGERIPDNTNVQQRLKARVV